LLSAEEGDLASVPQIGEKAGEILQAARAEAERHTLKIGEVPTTSDSQVGVNS